MRLFVKHSAIKFAFVAMLFGGGNTAFAHSATWSATQTGDVTRNAITLRWNYGGHGHGIVYCAGNTADDDGAPASDCTSPASELSAGGTVLTPTAAHTLSGTFQIVDLITTMPATIALAPATDYCFFVAGGSGNNPSPIKCFTTAAAPPTVMLSAMTAVRGVILAWTTAGNFNLAAGMNPALNKVERAVVTAGTAGDFTELCGAATTACVNPADLRYLDTAAAAGQTYRYQITVTGARPLNAEGQPVGPAPTATDTDDIAIRAAEIAPPPPRRFPGGR